MTLETLKENRNEIIETITETVGVNKVKEVMGYMVALVGDSSYKGMSVEQFTKAVISDMGVERSSAFTKDQIEEMRLKSLRNQRPSSMR